MEIKGIESRSIDAIEAELGQGGKFVIFTFVISVVLMTFRRPTAIYYIPPGSGAAKYAAGPTLTTLLLGLWGIPWGPIYTIQALFNNLRGGKDVTEAMREHLREVRDSEGQGGSAALEFGLFDEEFGFEPSKGRRSTPTSPPPPPPASP